MPTYEYQCKSCEHRFEQYQSIKDGPLRKCPECGKNTLERLIGTGAAVLFKGSGFYQTDYRSESYRKSAEADKPASGEAKSEKTAESKPETKGATGAGEKPVKTEKPAAKSPGGKPKKLKS